MSEIVLPKSKISAVIKNPNNLIIFSKPKTGKTSLLAGLDDCLILDLESGSDYVDALKLKASSIADIRAIGEQIKAEGFPYKFIAVDTITALEDLCIPYAEQLYSKLAIGKSWFKYVEGEPTKLAADSGKVIYGNIINLPNGAGYQHVRTAFIKVIEYIKTLASQVILLGHIKDTQLEKEGAEFTAMDLDLTGKLKRITTSQSDAIGYLYRKGNKNMLSFKTSDTVTCGARPEHLKNKEIVISEIIGDKLVTHWDRVYINN